MSRETDGLERAETEIRRLEAEITRLRAEARAHMAALREIHRSVTLDKFGITPASYAGKYLELWPHQEDFDGN